jgi:hypothetical protein
MARTIILRSPTVSEGYTEWLNKSTAINKNYFDAPDEYEELFQADFYREWKGILSGLFEDNFMNEITSSKLSSYLLSKIPNLDPDKEYLIDFCCKLLAACIKYPDATIETY